MVTVPKFISCYFHGCTINPNTVHALFHSTWCMPHVENSPAAQTQCPCSVSISHSPRLRWPGATEESRQEVFRMMTQMTQMTLKARSKWQVHWCSAVDAVVQIEVICFYFMPWESTEQLSFIIMKEATSIHRRPDLKVSKPSTSLAWQVFRPCLASDCLRQMSIRDIPRLKSRRKL